MACVPISVPKSLAGQLSNEMNGWESDGQNWQDSNSPTVSPYPWAVVWGDVHSAHAQAPATNLLHKLSSYAFLPDVSSRPCKSEGTGVRRRVWSKREWYHASLSIAGRSQVESRVGTTFQMHREYAIRCISTILLRNGALNFIWNEI